jgi:hypothetical protein
MREAVEILFHSYLASAPEGGKLLASRSDIFIPKKKPQVLIGKEPGWAPESIQTSWRREKLLRLREIKQHFLDYQASSEGTIPEHRGYKKL